MPIVSAAAVSGSVGKMGQKAGLGKIVETAMSQAVLACAREGVTDPDKIKERMLMASAKAKESFAAS